MSPTPSNDPGTMVALLVLIPLFIVFYLIPYVILTWKLFTKAGQPGWAAIIPVYNSMIMAEIGKKPVGLGVAAGVLGILSNLRFTGSFVLSIASLALTIILVVAMARQYNRGVWFWIGYIVAPIIAVFFLKNTVYTGAQSSAPATTPETPAAPTAQ